LVTPGLSGVAFDAFAAGLRARVYFDELHPVWTMSLVRSSLPVAAAPSPFVAGERAGSAGCDAVERGMLDVSSSQEVALQAFSGRWLRCSGALPERLEFDEQGRVRVLGEAGEVLEEVELRFTNGLPDTMNGPGILVSKLSLPFYSFVYSAVFSETPRKLYLGTQDQGVAR